MHKLVLIRHGESEWNKANKFTGWKDVDLSEKGRAEAQKAAKVLHKEGYTFDIAYTSVLTRAIRTLWSILDELDLRWIPVKRSWRLNERHYGGLQGLDKAETAAKYGEDQVFIWRRSFDTPPPQMEKDHEDHPIHDPRYRGVDPRILPSGESLSLTIDRVIPYWVDEIAPAILAGKKIIIAAHGNSLRALVKYLDEIPDDEINQFNIPTGIPLVYELDKNLRPTKRYFIGDPDEVKKAQEAVASQGKKKEG